jgi:uncharacterized protein (TIGR00156 family)
MLFYTREGGVMKIIGVFFLIAVLAGCPFDMGERDGHSDTAPFLPCKVSEAKNLPDDTHVILEGKITRHLGYDRYLFDDGLDAIIVEIDYDEWYGATVAADTVVIVYGEVDRSYQGVKIDVDRIGKKPLEKG